MKHVVLMGRKKIFVADFPFPQRNLCNFLINERGQCKCDFGCWLWPCPNKCVACVKVRSAVLPPIPESELGT